MPMCVDVNCVTSSHTATGGSVGIYYTYAHTVGTQTKMEMRNEANERFDDGHYDTNDDDG